VAGELVGVGGEVVERGARRAGREGPERVDHGGERGGVEDPAHDDQQGAVGVGQHGDGDRGGECGREVDRGRALQDLVDLEAGVLQAVDGPGEPAVEVAERVPGVLAGVDQLGDLRQGEPQVGEALDPQGPHEVDDAVLLVAVGAARRLGQQADVVVVPHRPDGGAGQFGELARAPGHSRSSVSWVVRSGVREPVPAVPGRRRLVLGGEERAAVRAVARGRLPPPRELRGGPPVGAATGADDDGRLGAGCGHVVRLARTVVPSRR
jgi:hypothetical protein